MNASVRNVPDWAHVSATAPSGFRTSVEVRNTTTATGTMITAIVRNWRRR